MIKINIYIREENGALKYEELNETAYEILDLVNIRFFFRFLQEKLQLLIMS